MIFKHWLRDLWQWMYEEILWLHAVNPEAEYLIAGFSRQRDESIFDQIFSRRNYEVAGYNSISNVFTSVWVEVKLALHCTPPALPSISNVWPLRTMALSSSGLLPASGSSAFEYPNLSASAAAAFT